MLGKRHYKREKMNYLKQILICCVLPIAANLLAQESDETNAFLPSFVEDPSICGNDENAIVAPPAEPWTLRIEGGYTVGRFMGFDRNYGEAGVFIAPRTHVEWLPFVDLRGYLIDNGKRAFGVGLGLRSWDDCTNRAWGGNVFYNYQEAKFSAFQRVGLGLESLGEDFDIRVNGYLVINGETKRGKLHTFHYPGDFIETCRIKEWAYSGVDAELGGYLCCGSCFRWYAGAGPYYFRTDCQHIFGGFFRLQLFWRDHLRLEGRVSEDSEFHTQYQGKILVSFPLYSLFTHDVTYEVGKCQILSQPVWRNPMITTQKCCDKTNNWSKEKGSGL